MNRTPVCLRRRSTLTISLPFVALLALSGPSHGERGDETRSVSSTKGGTLFRRTASTENDKLRWAPPKRTIADLKKRLGPLRPIPEDCATRKQIRTDLGSRKVATKTYSGNLQFVRSIAEREALKGNYHTAVRILDDALSGLHIVRQPLEGDSRGWADRYFSGGMYYDRARYVAFLGDFDQADRDRRKGRQALTHVWIGRAGKEAKKFFDVLHNATVSHARGEHRVADALYLQAVVLYGQTKPSWLTWNSGAVDPGLVNFDLIRAQWSANFLQMGRLVEAEIKARSTARSLYNLYRYSGKSAIGVERLAEVLLEQGRAAEAADLSRTAINMHQFKCALPDSLTLASARHTHAKVLIAGEAWDEALEQFERIERGLKGEPDTLHRTFGLSVEWPLTLAMTGRGDAAEVRASRGRGLAAERFGSGSYQALELDAVRGVAEAKGGSRSAAIETLSKALSGLAEFYLKGEDFGAGQRSRDQRFRLYVETYVEALTGSPRANPVQAAEAFRLIQLAEGREVHRALAASSARAASGDAELSALARRAQDARHGITAQLAMLANFSSLEPEEQDAAVQADLTENIARLRAEHAKLTEELETRFPKFTSLTKPRPATVQAIQQALKPDEALVLIHAGAEQSFVWAVGKQGRVAFSASPVSRVSLGQTVHRLRESLDPDAVVLEDIPAFDVGLAHELYKQLLAPVKSGWGGAKSLFVVADGPLGQLPLSLLVTESATVKDGGLMFDGYREVAWLNREHAVTVLPSAASLVTLRSNPAVKRGQRPFAGFGDPLFSPSQAVEASTGVSTRSVGSGLVLTRRSAPKTRQANSARLSKLPRLPETAEEVRSIAKALGADPEKDVFIGKRASERMVKTTDLSDRRVLAFATHGLVPGDLDGLSQPALALTSPRVLGDEEDGLLTMGEILGLQLNADWVVLSACNTGAAQGEGAEAVSGLGRAFFYAGARSLLVSNWPVETTSAKAITTGVFSRQAKNRGLSRAEALRQTLSELIERGAFKDPATGKALFAYAHPIFWAPFSVVGDSGVGAAR